MKKGLSILLALIIVMSVLVVLPFTANAEEVELTEDGANVELAESGAISQSDFNSRINSLRNDYPNGYYWDGSFDGGIQCYGFARLVAYNVFYSHVNSWSVSDSLDGVKAGDVVQYGNTSGYGHTIFVLSVSGSTIKYVDCNGNGGYCRVRWDDSITIGAKIFGLYSFNYRYVSPGVDPDPIPDPTPQGHVMSDSEGAGKTIPDGDYWICSRIAQDYFIDVPGDDFNTSDGKNLETWIWNPSLSLDYLFPGKWDVFHFTYLNNGFYRITQYNTNMAIDVDGASLYRGTNVQMWGVNSSNAQQWSIEKTDKGYKLRAKCNSYYMDINGAAHNGGTNVQTWEGNDSDAQYFGFIPYSPDERPFADGCYSVASGVGNNCYLDVSGIPGEYSNKSNVQIWNGVEPDETFRFEYAGKGFYRIYEATSNLAVEIINEGAYLDECKNAILYGKTNSRGQLWKIRKNSDGTYCFINALSGYCLDVEGGKTDKGTNVRTYLYNGSNAQKWKPIRVLQDDMISIPSVRIENLDDTVNPKVSIKVDNKELSQNTDYSVEITTDIENGIGTATIKGKNNYCGTVAKSFEILYSHYEYKVLEDNTIEITKYIGTERHLEVPETIDGYYVSSIGDNAFEDNKLVSMLIINTPIINSRAFSNCSSLKTIFIHESVTNIDLSAFSACNQLRTISVDANNQYYSSSYGMLFNKDKTELYFYEMGRTATTVTVPNTVTKIHDAAFRNCSSLVEIDLPDGITEIGYRTFIFCSSLETITIPNNVTSIGFEAFGACEKLKTIELPDSVKSIDASAFVACTALESINIPEGITEIKDSTFYECINLKSITLPDSVTKIESSSFEDCESLKEITFSSNVTEIGSGAFANCTQLSDVYFYGTQKQWESINIDDDNQQLLSATIHFMNQETLLIGDADGDGKISAIDVTQIMRKCARLDTGIDEAVLMNGDVDGNGKLEIIDATYIQRHLAKMETPYQIGKAKG